MPEPYKLNSYEDAHIDGGLTLNAFHDFITATTRRLTSLSCLLVIVACLVCAGASVGTLDAAEGFDHIIKPAVEGFERLEQPKFWIMEVQCKPMRLMWVDLTDPKTGQKTTEQIWYLVYRGINRPIRKPLENNTIPDNVLDPEPGPSYFTPEFTLVTKDGSQTQTIIDSVWPEAQRQIIARERRELKNSVEVVGPIPAPVDGEPKDDESLYGIALFRGVDPETDRFVVYMSGFSNGYRQVSGPDGNPIVERKTIRQEFWRPGDQFDPNLREFRFEGDAEWIYRAEVVRKP